MMVMEILTKQVATELEAEDWNVKWGVTAAACGLS